MLSQVDLRTVFELICFEKSNTTLHEEAGSFFGPGCKRSLIRMTADTCDVRFMLE